MRIVLSMEKSFAERLKELRTSRDMSQNQLAEALYVSRTTITRWENGSRIPDMVMLKRMADLFDVDLALLLSGDLGTDIHPALLVVDDNKVILRGEMKTLISIMPDAEVSGFSTVAEAIEYTQNNRVDLAFLDIEMGPVSGLELCRSLLHINPQIRVIFLTAYPDYALPAWETGACGFLVKPLTPDKLKRQFQQLHII